MVNHAQTNALKTSTCCCFNNPPKIFTLQARSFSCILIGCHTPYQHCYTTTSYLDRKDDDGSCCAVRFQTNKQPVAYAHGILATSSTSVLASNLEA
ncbi:hypothetical protein AVEN_273418-1 [Araneus ventricosus]|uniref:Uncharacterized protein n=1 Tax=Araneus ventricosus TaxID=182803 RepID=A0A4Y2E1P2_ARAVE|nr:hypothetical protein AVEN_273418-1 [Araneus ventricosus]